MSLGGRRVSRSDFCANLHLATLRTQCVPDGRQRFLEVLVNIVAEGLKGGHIENCCLVLQTAAEGLSEQPVEGSQKRSKGLSGTRRRGDQGVTARLNGRPAAPLWFARSSELPFKPLRDCRMKLLRLHRSGPNLTRIFRCARSALDLPG